MTYLNPTIEALKAEAGSFDAMCAGGAVTYISTVDEVSCCWLPDAIEGEDFEFRHNGVRIDEVRALELVA